MITPNIEGRNLSYPPAHWPNKTTAFNLLLVVGNVFAMIYCKDKLMTFKTLNALIRIPKYYLAAKEESSDFATINALAFVTMSLPGGIDFLERIPHINRWMTIVTVGLDLVSEAYNYWKPTPRLVQSNNQFIEERILPIQTFTTFDQARDWLGIDADSVTIETIRQKHRLATDRTREHQQSGDLSRYLCRELDTIIQNLDSARDFLLAELEALSATSGS